MRVLVHASIAPPTFLREPAISLQESAERNLNVNDKRYRYRFISSLSISIENSDMQREISV